MVEAVDQDDVVDHILRGRLAYLAAVQVDDAGRRAEPGEEGPGLLGSDGIADRRINAVEREAVWARTRPLA